MCWRQLPITGAEPQRHITLVAAVCTDVGVDECGASFCLHCSHAEPQLHITTKISQMCDAHMITTVHDIIHTTQQTHNHPWLQGADLSAADSRGCCSLPPLLALLPAADRAAAAAANLDDTAAAVALLPLLPSPCCC